MSEHTRALLAEIAGTFMFFVIGAGAIVTAAISAAPGTGLVPVALAHGLALAIAVSSFGAISGGHFNPAVTFGLAIARKHPWPRVLTYWAAQLIGALLAGLVLRLFFEPFLAAATATHLGTPIVNPAVSPVLAIVIEAVLTLFLVWTVFGTAVSPNAPRIAGFGIGLIVAADILIGGPLTGAAMNPARHFGPAVVSGYLDDWYVYWIGPLIGAALAGLSYRYAFGPPEDREPLPDLRRATPSVRPGPAMPAAAEPHSGDRTERM
ncbi:MAG TPA: MIP family channel protein [Candidatus Saccharimonadales bacterium]|nr:MIP family channel protein [Candidatus Saccharimonadales bacterium]